MPQFNANALAALISREFKRVTGKPETQPVRTRFRSKRLRLSKFDDQWDRRRGSAIRLTTVLLNEDDSALAQRVCESEASTKTYRAAITWLAKEAAHLRKASRLHDTAVARLTAVMARCEEPQTSN